MTDMQPTYRLADAARGAGLTATQLRNWTDRGWVAPLGDAGRHAGGHRRYSVADVLRLALVEELRLYGVAVDDAVALVDGYASWRLGHLARTGASSLGDALRGDTMYVTRHGGRPPLARIARTVLTGADLLELERPRPHGGAVVGATDIGGANVRDRAPSFVAIHIDAIAELVAERLAAPAVADEAVRRKPELV